MFKKIRLLLFTSILLVAFTYGSTFAETLISEKTKSQVVSEGVTLENIARFTSNGWLNINVLRVDLTNPYINIDTMFDKNGSSIRQTTQDMVKDYDAVAGVNGDFFSAKKNSNLAHAIGPLVQNGKIITTPASKENKNIFAVFSLTKNKLPLINYWSKTAKATAPNGSSMDIYDINKFGWFEYLYMYDRNWGPKTIGKSDVFKNIVEMVVVNNKVKSFSVGSGPINIPENGYVLAGDYNAGKFLTDNFKIGDTVKVDIKTNPTWKSLKMAIGGGSILVKNGKIPSSFSLSEENEVAPCTSLGITKNNKEIILVTVDGRQIISKGLDAYSMAKLMVELGAYNAIQFDGGGSTTMVSKTAYNPEVKVINSYSDPSQRAVSNAVAIFSNPPKGTLKEMKIETIDTNVFLNASRIFTVLGTDTYYNPISVNIDDVKWQCEGVKGKFVKNTFYPSSTGTGKITASIGNVKSSIEINVLDTPVELKINNTNFPLSKEPQWLAVDGIDKNGYAAFISSDDLTFNNKDIFNITNNYIRSSNEKPGIVKVSFGNVYTYFSISSPNSVLNTFDKETDSFWGYPSTVTGSYKLTSEIAKEGSSGKLQFDFNNTEDTKAAYIRFGKNTTLNSNPEKMGIWVYSKENYPYSLKMEFTDSNGQVQRATFANSINWTGWRENTLKFDENTSFPITINKIYIVDTTNKKGTGTVYFDNLKAYYSGNGIIKLPKSKIIPDYQNKTSALKGTKNSYNISVFGDISTSNQQIISKINSSSNKASYSIYLGKMVEGLNEPPSSNNMFFISDYKNSKIINIKANGTKPSIRKNDYNQWIKLLDTLKSNDKDNIFINLDCSLDSFYDIYEANLFKETLNNYVKTNKKNVWVLYPSNKNISTNENGVKYIGVKKCSSKISDRQYLSITVNEKDTTYKFKRIGL